MEQEEFMFYGIYFDVKEIPKNSEAFKEYAELDRNNFVDHYLGDVFGNFCFGYHKPSKKCFLSLYGIYGETTTDEFKKLIKRFDMGELKKELEKIQLFFGLNKTVNWYFLI